MSIIITPEKQDLINNLGKILVEGLKGKKNKDLKKNFIDDTITDFFLTLCDGNRRLTCSYIGMSDRTLRDKIYKSPLLSKKYHVHYQNEDSKQFKNYVTHTPERMIMNLLEQVRRSDTWREADDEERKEIEERFIRHFS